MAARARGGSVAPCIVVYAPRERARALVRGAFPRRRGRLVATRQPEEFAAAFQTTLVDAAIVDVGAAGDAPWRAAALASEYPSVPFFAVTPLLPGDAGALARCAGLDFCDVLVDGVDEAVARDLVVPRCFSVRFAEALEAAPPALGLTTPLQQSTWRCLVRQAGRPVRTEELAHELGMTREHLSRSFSAHGAPNLKRVIDLVRLITAAELAKNPGYDIRDVARVLGFASSSHLSSTAQRVVGTRPASLARLRAVDLVERFAQGRARSRRTALPRPGAAPGDDARSGADPAAAPGPEA